jgi:hypothetical protein
MGRWYLMPLVFGAKRQSETPDHEQTVLALTG